MAARKKLSQQIEALQSGDVQARKDAARWLGRQDAPDAFGLLVAALQDDSWKVRRSAAVALGQSGNPEAVEPLLAAMTGKQTLSFQRAAIVALGAIRDVRAIPRLAACLTDDRVRDDALKSLCRIGAPALLYCCRIIHTEGADPRWQETVRQMILPGADPFLRGSLSEPSWTGRERWLTIETVRTVQVSLSFLDTLRLSKFSRVTDISVWCERILRDPNEAALYIGARQVLDYLMLGRASRRDFTTEGEELLRAASGTKHRDTGETLLRASDQGDSVPQKLSLLGRLRRWLKQEG